MYLPPFSVNLLMEKCMGHIFRDLQINYMNLCLQVTYVFSLSGMYMSYSEQFDTCIWSVSLQISPIT
jgi:hypothetical protein